MTQSPFQYSAGRILALCVTFFAAHLFAAPSANLSLVNDAATGGPGRFAAEEIRREAVAKGGAVGDDANATRITLAVQKDAKAAAQSYSIRVQNEGFDWDPYWIFFSTAILPEP